MIADGCQYHMDATATRLQVPDAIADWFDPEASVIKAVVNLD